MKGTDRNQVIVPQSPQFIKAMQRKEMVNFGQININTNTNIDNWAESGNSKDVLLQVIENQHNEIMHLLGVIDRLQDKVFVLMEKTI